MQAEQRSRAILLAQRVAGAGARRQSSSSSGSGIPGEEDALHHVEVLHEHVSLRLRAEVAHCVPDPQLDGTLQGGRGGLRGELEASEP